MIGVRLGNLKVHKLRTEYQYNPLGIEVSCPRLSWEIQSAQRAVRQQAYRIIAASSPENLKASDRLLWDSGVQHSQQSIHVAFPDHNLAAGQRIHWQVQVWDNLGNEATSDEVAWWEMGFIHHTAMKADWITPAWEVSRVQSEPCPFFRKTFSIGKPLQSARIYATALGLYELEINGQKVGDEVFTPGWTNYKSRLQYQVYDVTGCLSEGPNVLGAILGDGWYRGHFGWWDNNRNNYGEEPGLLVQLEVRYEDGSLDVIATDQSWKCHTGPLLKSDIYEGEHYDARLEMPGWSASGFDDSLWKNAAVLDHTKETLVASVGEKVRKVQELTPVELIETPNGERVFDLGQNMVGWVRLKVAGKRGDEVTLRFAEVLDRDGNFYTENLRKIACTDRYVLKGEGIELYEPRFTFHGFRYVQVEGYPGDLQMDSITGIVVHSDMMPTGTFQCSDPLVNQLQKNIQWGQKGNFLDVPTDCPQRDERLGWTGDAQVFAPTASFNFNTAPFFTKWLRDLTSEQRADGSVPWVVPNIIRDGGGTGWSDGFGATGWADAAVVIPWVLYQSYGDQRILEEQYTSMKAWVDYMKHHAGDKLIFDYGFHFGDWLSFSDYASYNYNAPDYGYAGAHTDKALLATAYFYRSASILKKTAEILGRESDVQELKGLIPGIKEAWNREFATASGRLVSGTQTAYAIGLCFGLIPDAMQEVIAERLANDVKYFGHLTTGFLGTPVLNYALSDFGYADQAYQLLMNRRYPSWLYPVTMGATTIWERWDGIRPDGTFQTVGMNSFNHYAYGAVGEWLYSRVAGLRSDPANPGYKNIIFQPCPGGGLTAARADLDTMYGKAVSSWELNDNQVHYMIEIPANATGTVAIPAVPDSVRIDRDPLSSSALINNIQLQNGLVSFGIGSGVYKIEFELTR